MGKKVPNKYIKEEEGRGREREGERKGDKREKKIRKILNIAHFTECGFYEETGEGGRLKKDSVSYC